MGTPKSSFSPRLVDIITNPPKTDEDWLKQVENLAELIQPNLRAMTLKRIHSVPCLGTKGPCHDFANSHPIPRFTDAEGNEVDPDVRGLFHWAGSKTTVKYGEVRHNRFGGLLSYPDGHTMIWGLKRDGNWISITVCFKGEVVHHNSEKPWEDYGYQRAQEVRITTVELHEMCRLTSVHPKEVYIGLLGDIEEWYEHRKLLLGFAQHAYDASQLEASALLGVGALSSKDFYK